MAIVGIVSGTTTGVLSMRQHSTDSSIPPNNESGVTVAATNILGSSSLTAVNFTDPDEYNHHMVFFEDGYNAIVARQEDARNRMWATGDVT